MLKLAECFARTYAVLGLPIFYKYL